MNQKMNKGYIIVFFLLFQICTCSGQSLYFKTNGGYQVPINKQQMPAYFTYTISRTIPWVGMDFNINLNNSDFSIAEGFNYQGIIGYTLNDLISLELAFSYFNNYGKEFEASPKLEYTYNGKTNWNYKNYGLFPTLSIGQTFKKSRININLFTGAGYGDLKIKASLHENFNKYVFDKSISYTYGYGIEYIYKISSIIQVFANAGISNTMYTPKHAELVSSSGSMKYLRVYEKEIDYAREIKDLKLVYNFNNQQYTSNIDEPEVRLQETLKLNSIYLGIGIKYNLSKDEKK